MSDNMRPGVPGKQHVEILDNSSQRRSHTYLLLPGIVAVLAFAVDRVSKALVEHQLKDILPINVIGDYFRIVLWYNDGVAFGMHLGGGWVHITLSFVAMALVLFMTWHTADNDRLSLWGFGLIMGGALGNLWDRVTNGGVTDFLDVGVGPYRWPTFNVADSCVVIGIGLLILAHIIASHANVNDDEELHVPDSDAATEPEVGPTPR